MYLGGLGKVLAKVYDAALTALRVVNRRERILPAVVFNQAHGGGAIAFTVANDLNGLYVDNLVWLIESVTGQVDTYVVQVSADNITFFDYYTREGGAQTLWFISIGAGVHALGFSAGHLPVAARYVRLRITAGGGAGGNILVISEEVR